MKEVIFCGVDSTRYCYEIKEYLEQIIKEDDLDMRFKGYLDSSKLLNDKFNSIKYLGDFNSHSHTNNYVYIIGALDSKKRLEIFSFLEKNKYPLINIIHPNALISSTAKLGKGIVLGPNVFIMSNTIIGNHSVFNYGCSVGHDSCLGVNNIFSSNCNLAGNVQIKNHNFFGISSSIIPNITIGDYNKVQAGTTVNNNLNDRSFYFQKNQNKVSHIF